MAKSAKILIVSGASLPTQPFGPQLHSLINEAYLIKPENYSVFPPTWTRLHPDPARGIEGLAEELGDLGHFAVAFDPDNDDYPIACGGVLPYRGDDWINEAFDKSNVELANRNNGGLDPDSISDWETSCWCVRPSARGQRLSFQILHALVPYLKARGGQRFFTNYVIDETGEFWPKLGFERVPHAGGMLPKGFQAHPDKEGLRADVHFGLGVRSL